MSPSLQNLKSHTQNSACNNQRYIRRIMTTAPSFAEEQNYAKNGRAKEIDTAVARIAAHFLILIS